MPNVLPYKQKVNSDDPPPPATHTQLRPPVKCRFGQLYKIYCLWDSHLQENVAVFCWHILFWFDKKCQY